MCQRVTIVGNNTKIGQLSRVVLTHHTHTQTHNAPIHAKQIVGLSL